MHVLRRCNRIYKGKGAALVEPVYESREAHAVTASVDHVSFRRPIHLGNVLTISACVTHAFNSSVEIFIKVTTGNVTQGETHVSNHAYMTFVALDPYTHKPKSVPKVKPSTEKEHTLYDGAIRRRELRLILAGRMEAKDAVEIKALFSEAED